MTERRRFTFDGRVFGFGCAGLVGGLAIVLFAPGSLAERLVPAAIAEVVCVGLAALVMPPWQGRTSTRRAGAWLALEALTLAVVLVAFRIVV